MRRWSLILSFLISLFATSHAMADSNWWEDKKTCIAVGAVAGAGIGATADAATAGAGAVVGGLLGALLCQPADLDGDGVPDHRDDCPGTPKGVAVDDKGCPPDSDGDGVPDYLDKCPDTPKGAKVDEHGCEPPPPAAPPAEPMPAAPVDADSDGDGVPDRIDKCPDTPPGARVDHTGCPLVDTSELKGVWFAFDSSAITPESAAVLDEVALVFKRYPTLVAEMAGHTCNIGTEQYNQGLSERRANAVRDYLIGKGVAPEQLTAKGYGELQPMTSNATIEGRRSNRRTEMQILKQ
jgi:OOP family OmpA-OmpF porin